VVGKNDDRLSFRNMHEKNEVDYLNLFFFLRKNGYLTIINEIVSRSMEGPIQVSLIDALWQKNIPMYVGSTYLNVQ